jgi:hypothetical protein
MNVKKLELFRDGTINLSKLTNNGKIDLFNVKIKDEVQVKKEHFINILSKFKNKEISEQDILEWIYTIRFTDVFSINEFYHESISDVMEMIQRMNLGRRIGNYWEVDIKGIVNKKEPIYLGKRISDTEIDKYIDAMNKNIEL